MNEREVMVLPQRERGLEVGKALRETRGYHLFVDMCEFCREAGVVGLCEGAVGVGKTEAARRYSQWDLVEPQFSRHGSGQNCVSSGVVMPRVGLYRVGATSTPKRMEQDLALLRWELQRLCEKADSGIEEEVSESGYIRPGEVELLIIDEANRLCRQGLEVLRDVFEEARVSLVLLGYAGLKQKVLAQPALASRVGVHYAFEGLCEQEVRQLLQEYIRGRGVEVKYEVASVRAGKTQGNIQAVLQVLKQIEYLLRINKLTVLSKRVVEVASSQLLRRG